MSTRTLKRRMRSIFYVRHSFRLLWQRQHTSRYDPIKSKILWRGGWNEFHMSTIPMGGGSINTLNMVTSIIHLIFIKSPQLFPGTLGVHLDLLWSSSPLAKSPNNHALMSSTESTLWMVRQNGTEFMMSMWETKDKCEAVETKGWHVGGTSTVLELPLWATFSLHDSPHKMCAQFKYHKKLSGSHLKHTLILNGDINIDVQCAPFVFTMKMWH